jgi:hypothetical protein
MTAPVFGERFSCRSCKGKGTLYAHRTAERRFCPDCDGGLVTAAQLRVQLVALAQKILADPSSGSWDRASAQAYLNGAQPAATA